MSDAVLAATTETPAAEVVADASLINSAATETAAPATFDQAALDAAVAAVKPVVPETYEFTPPEVDGKPVAVDQAALEAFQGTAKELGLTQEQFQGVTKAGLEKIAALASAPYQAWADQQSKWTTEIKADPEIGGDKLAPSLANAKRAIDQFGGDALRQALDFTGAGNNPAIVKAFVAIGRALGDSEGFLTGKPAAGARAASREQAARDFFNAGGGSYPDVAV